MNLSVGAGPKPSGGESRVLVGFHFRHAVVDGIAHGKHIGNWTVGNFMQPVDD